MSWTFLLSIELSCSNTACCCIDDSRYMKKRRVNWFEGQGIFKKGEQFQFTLQTPGIIVRLLWDKMW